MKKVETRQKEIMEIVDNMRHITITELSNMLGVSHLTIRRDLKILEKKEHVYLSYGGIVFSNDEVLNYAGRMKQNADVKAEIAKTATKYVENNDIIYIGGGTTCVEFAKNLVVQCNEYNLNIVTSCPKVASIVSNMPDVSITMLGGEYVNENESITSLEAIGMVEKLNFEKSFLSCLGLSEKKGAMYMYYMLAKEKKIVAENSKQCIIMCDSEKIGRYSMSTGIDIDDINVIITNTNDKNKEELEKIKKHGISIDVIENKAK